MVVHGTIRIVLFMLMHIISLISCGQGARHRLLQDLLNSYPLDGKYVIPVKSHTEALSVGLAVQVDKVLHVDQQKETVAIRVYNNYNWRDDFLSWDPQKYEGIDIVVLPTQQLWLPDVNIFDVVSEECIHDDKAIVYSTGTVSWVPSCVQEIGCNVDPLYFPFDKHQCKYRVGSWLHSNRSLVLENLGVKRQKPQFQQEWSLYSINSHMEHIDWDNEIYSKIVVSYKIYHHAPLFAFLLIFPSVLLSIMTSVVFLLPTDNENKINVGMSIFLSFMVLLHILMDSTPKSSVTVPYLGYYFSLNSVLIAMSVFSATITSNLCAKAAAGNLMQPWTKKILSLMAKVMKVDISPVTPVTPKDASTKMSTEVNGNNDRTKQKKNGWILLAIVLDRFLFLIYVFANVFTTAALFSKYLSF